MIAFVTSANSSSEDDCYIDAFGSHCLSIFRALGLPSTAVLIRVRIKIFPERKSFLSFLGNGLVNF